MEITKKDLQKYCMDATEEFLEGMEDLNGVTQTSIMLTIIAFTATLSKKMFPEENRK